MGVPLSYNFRSLIERRGTTLMTAVGIGLTVAVLVVSMALMNGLRATFAASGHPRQAIILRKGTNSELSSWLNYQAIQEFRILPQLERNADGQPLASPEVVVVINLPSVDSPSGMNVTVRGVLPIGLEMRDTRILSGRMFAPGKREVIVGAGIARRYPAAQLGKSLRFGQDSWEVVGVFSGRDEMSAIASEIWGDLNQVRDAFDRQGGASSVLVRVRPGQSLDELIKSVEDNQRVGAGALNERKYFADMTSSGTPLEMLGMMIAVIMAIGSGFGAMNTMYAAVARRGKEIGTLRALGFSRWSILRSFIFESVMLAMMGGVLGCLLALPVNDMTTGVGNFNTFSEVAFQFRVGPGVLIQGMIFAIVIGTLGGFLPARAAARRDLVTTLREG